ncbi:MAG: TonB-dependent receptor plug domain-containing protein, partial [Bacteroidales bacterium]|nr:TonB-dependent receptor plug domain-containing protein [Bacteroidales bacterium]
MKRVALTFLLSLSLSAVIAQTQEPDKQGIVIELEGITVSSQHGEQGLLDVPAAITVVGARTLESTNTASLEQLAGFVPGLNVLVQTQGRPNLVIRGLTSDEVSPSAQPRVSVYFDHAPTSRASMALTELYDMERVEVLKGPQGTLFGRGSQAGAIHFITQKPTNLFGGYAAIGAGDYGMKHLEGALNIPVISDVLSTRIAGIYSYRDGYVKNNSGGTLNGKNTAGMRFSTSFTPKNSRFKADLTINYQNDNNSGTAFINPLGGTKVFDYEVYLDHDKEFYNKREVLGTILNARYYTNEQNYFSAISSYFNNTADARFDGDGTSGAAIDMTELVSAAQFMQEIRYNFSLGNRLTGVAGASFWREDVSQTYDFRPNEQYAAWLIFEMPTFLIHGTKMTFQSAMPHIGLTEDLYFTSDHEEVSTYNAVNSAFDLFFDACYKLLPKLSFTAGVRATFENFSIKNRAYHSAGEPSVIGQWFVFSDNVREPSFFINAPNREAVNFFFYPVENPKVEDAYFALTWRAGLK